MPRSRLNQKLVKQTERNLILIVGAGIIALILFIFFGVKLLVNFSLFIEKKTETSSQTDAEGDAFIPPPTLETPVSSTNSASLDISGSVEDGEFVKLYVNGKMVKKADITSDHTFTLRSITLEPGENDIKAKTVMEGDKESKFSDTVSVTYSNKAPDLSIDFPTDGEKYHKDNNPLKVRGKTTAGARVTVNDFWAISDGDGNYSYNLLLHNDDNQIKVVATDDAGNKTEKSIKVSYSE